MVPCGVGGVRRPLPGPCPQRILPRMPPRMKAATTGVTETPRPNSEGKFGRFGGQYVPEDLIRHLKQLETAYHTAKNDPTFQAELETVYKDYVGRESPLYFAPRLSEYYKRQIYLKREDLNHTGAHKINNSLGQVLLCERMGKKRIIAETGAGQHGTATVGFLLPGGAVQVPSVLKAAACAKYGLECHVYMGTKDMRRQKLNVFRMELCGAKVVPVTAGTATLMEAVTEAIEKLIEDPDSTHYCLGSVCGPHPYPEMVRDFQSVIGQETRRQLQEKIGRGPDVLIACVGGGSNAMGLFNEFVNDENVRLIGVEAAGKGVDSEFHSATMTKGSPGVLHGSFSMLLQNSEGEILDPYSISPGLGYSGVGPEHSFLSEAGRAEYYAVTDEEALQAFERLSRLEGIIPALETSHAIAYLKHLCPTVPEDTVIVINCSGRGDKDVDTAMKHFNYQHS